MSVVVDRYLIFEPITGRDRLVESCYILPRPRMFRLFTYLQLDREGFRFATLLHTVFSRSLDHHHSRSVGPAMKETGILVPGLGLAAADQAAG